MRAERRPAPLARHSESRWTANGAAKRWNYGALGARYGLVRVLRKALRKRSANRRYAPGGSDDQSPYESQATEWSRAGADPAVVGRPAAHARAPTLVLLLPRLSGSRHPGMIRAAPCASP